MGSREMMRASRGEKSGWGVLAIGAGIVVVIAGTALLVLGDGPGGDGSAVDGGGRGAGAGAAAIALDRPEAVWDEAFSLISTVRELPDGRLLVADPLGQVVMRLDLDAGVADTIGGVGEGPEEYRQPDAVWPLPGGRTLLVDLGNGRLTELDSTLAFGDTRPYALSVGGVDLGAMTLALPAAVDGRGGLYFRGFGQPGERDSTEVFRYDFETAALDTVAVVKIPDVVVETSRSAAGQSTSISQVPLSPADSWGVAADGRVVVARSSDFRVEWIQPDGSVTSGPSVPFTPVGIGRAEREQWADERMEQGGSLSIGISNNNGVVTMTASRGGASSNDEGLDDQPWPEVKPPFYDAPIPVDGLGRAWVRRHREAGESPAYDLFDGNGEAVMTVEFGEGRRVVGFGDGVLYAVRMDMFGLHTLERYALP